jgi:hypothetical protein
LEILSHRVEFFGRCGAYRRRGVPSTPHRRYDHGR